MGKFEELELERSVRALIIAAIRREMDVKSVGRILALLGPINENIWKGT